MIKFFRTVRKALLIEGKTNNYLKYAIGEIVLVVIGILIALQINNWNETRKERIYEIKMLSEVRNSLQKDINDKQNVIDIYFKPTENSINELLKMRENPEYPRDSAKVHLQNLERIGLFFPYSDGAFEALKSSGLDKISNDEIRNALIQLYSYSMKSTSIFVNELVRPTMIEKYSLFGQIFPTTMHSGTDGKAELNQTYDNFDELLYTQDFDKLLHKANLIVDGITPRIEHLVKKMIELERLIANEIEKQSHTNNKIDTNN